MKTIKPSVKTIASLDKDAEFNPLEFFVAYATFATFKTMSLHGESGAGLQAGALIKALWLEANISVEFENVGDLKAYMEKLQAWVIAPSEWPSEKVQDFHLLHLKQIKANLEHHLNDSPNTSDIAYIVNVLRGINKAVVEVEEIISERGPDQEVAA